MRSADSCRERTGIGDQKPLSDSRSVAFSLVELLAVMAIIAVMASVSVPAIASLGKASDMNRAVAGLALTFEQARAYAMAHATYVRVGVRQDAAAGRVDCAAVAGSGGATNDFSDPSGYRPISRLQRFDHVRFGTGGALPGMAADAPDMGTSGGLDFQMAAAGGNQTYTSVVQFSPSGEATLGSATQPRWVQVGVVPAVGATGDYAVLQISGLTGQVRIFRP